MPSLAVILPAAGRSIRFGGSRNKLFESLAGSPVLLHSARAFNNRSDVEWVVIPTHPDLWNDAPPGLRDSLEQSRARFCPGGASRAQSVRNALETVPESIEWVAVHDAARPLVSQGLIGRTFAAAREHGAAVPALPVHLTIKQAAGPLPARVERTLPRRQLWAMQTPQIMRRSDLLDAFAACPIPLDEVTDDVQLLELAGREVWLIPGEERNLKITTPIDLRIAEMILSGIS